MDIKINKEIRIHEYTFKVGDIVTTYDKSHFFNILTTDTHNQKIIIPFVFGVTINDKGKEVVSNINLAKIKCSEFIKNYIK